MQLLPREVDRLGMVVVAGLAQKRLSQGLQIGHSEAAALIAVQVLERIRSNVAGPEGALSGVASYGRRLLGHLHVFPGVLETLQSVQIEGSFLDGTKLVTVHDPITRNETLSVSEVLKGSGLPVPDPTVFLRYRHEYETRVIPGEMLIYCQDSETPENITLSPGRPRRALSVTNTGDRPVQVGSHYHFIETNRALAFDRRQALGHRLDIPAGTAVRFEPGDTKIVSLVLIGGSQRMSGGNGLVTGRLSEALLQEDSLIASLQEKGFSHRTDSLPDPASFTMDRRRYVDAYGPTTGDRVRLGDTGLFACVERDFAYYGDEAVFGGGKVIREGMGQMTQVTTEDALDLVITSVLVIDYTGIYKADVGIKGTLIAGIGKAGNPDVMDGVTMIIGATTEVLSGEGRTLVAGGIDTHVHFICPQLCTEALASGLTTLIGGGTGPNTGTNATTCTPGAKHIRMMLRATDGLPLNIGFTGKGNCSWDKPLREQIEAGAVGLKLHEDWGTTPESIDTCLSVCDELDVQTTIHTDTLNESGFVDSSVGAFKGRTIHAYHTEGAGGGHAPDIITVCGQENVIPSSTNPTRPYTINTLDEHLDMLMVCHHLNRDIPEDIAFAESRIRGETIGAEDELHDMGAISIISSDSQAMGRIGEVITRTWQTADKMKGLRGPLQIGQKQDPITSDNLRIKRYVAKYTINPAIAHGVSDIVGSIEVGKMADLVLYKPAFFGTRPDIVIKGGIIAWAAMGDANASIPTPEPVIGRPMFGSFPKVAADTSLAFVSQVSLERVSGYGLDKTIHAVKKCRGIGKKDMKWNDLCPKITVDAETYEVRVDGRLLSVGPATTVPLGQHQFLF